VSSTLTHSPAEITRQLLLDAGEGWQVFVSNLPPVPDDVIVVYDTQGRDDGRTFDGELQSHEGLQLLFRSTDHRTGWLKANEWRTNLSENVNQEIVTMPDGSQFLVWCYAKIGNILAIGTDSPRSKRYLFTLNCTIALREILILGTAT
jgi:hypothetical protein